MQCSLADSQPRNEPGPSAVDTAEFDMRVRKVADCPLRTVHDWQTCPYAHPGEKARRRDPSCYTGIACVSMKEEGACPLGDSCPHAHSAWEYWLHPTRYKTALCSRGAGCQRTFCFFAHHPCELRTPTERPGVPPAAAAAAAAAMASSPAPLGPLPAAQQQQQQQQQQPGGPLALPAAAAAAAAAQQPAQQLGQQPGSWSPNRREGGVGARNLGGSGSSRSSLDMATMHGAYLDPLGGVGPLGLVASGVGAPPAAAGTAAASLLPIGIQAAYGTHPAYGPQQAAFLPGSQGSSWPHTCPQSLPMLLPTSPQHGLLNQSLPQQALASPPISLEGPPPAVAAAAGSSWGLLQGKNGAKQAVLQAVSHELALGRMDTAQAAAVLGALLPTEELLQLALTQDVPQGGGPGQQM